MKIKFSMHDSFLDIGRNLLVTEIVDKTLSNTLSLIQFKTGQYCCKAKDNSCHHDFTSTF
jgi:endonuclease III